MPKIEKEYEHTRPFLTVAYNPLRLLVRQATTKGYIECYRGGGALMDLMLVVK